MVGSSLGPFKILEPLGAGGMGEVYLAEDTRLSRRVALKILPPDFADDPDRMARFEREAKLLASLSHPHIAGIYGLEDHDDKRFITMELVEGETLAERIERGPMDVNEALPIARQIAGALEAAHDRGIIHRDLKPANVKITPDGEVKVLDFGLAKAFVAEGPGADRSPELSASPTILAATGAGVILGTAAYMSPEQAKGRPLDRRADVWAFGVVLYEMLTGRRAFSGDDVTEVVAAVIRDTPDLEALPAGASPALRRLLRRCLEKDPRKRLRDMGDVGIEIDEAIEPPDEVRRDAAAAGARPSAVALATAGVALVAITAVATWLMKPAPSIERRLTRFSVVIDPAQGSPNQAAPSVALSPDGGTLAYLVGRSVFVRELDQLEPRRLIDDVSAIWFSPDGESLLLEARAGLAKVRLNGGTPQQVAPAADIRGADWGDDGTIVFVSERGIYRVPDSGGTPEPIVDGEGGVWAWPQILPGGEFILHAQYEGSSGNTVVRRIDGSDPRIVLTGFVVARYVETGHLVGSTSEGRLQAVPFDLATGTVTGPPVSVPEVVAVSLRTGWSQFVIAGDGTMAYAPPLGQRADLQLAWVDADGAAQPAFVEPRVYSDVRLAPDGRRVAAHLWDEDNDVWVIDLARGGLTRITFAPGEDETPVWSPDGLDVAYAADRAGQPRTLFRKRADGSAAATEQVIWQNPAHFHVNDWSPDGRTLLVQVSGASNDVVAIDVASGEETPLLHSPYNEHLAKISPDGRWIAYVSDESGREEVYVQRYPALDARVPVSTDGGGEPVWSPTGDRLFFRSEGSFMVATVITDSPLEFSAPEALFADHYVRTQGVSHLHYDVAPDGRLLVVENPALSNAAEEPFRINVVLNWAEQLKRLAPTGR